MRINTNVSSLTAQEAAQNTSKRLTTSLEKLSTGLRINKASDDASGLAIADKLRTQATSINQGIANGNSAVSLLQIADKSMAEQSNILDTIKAKLIQANTDTTSADGRESIRKDIAKLLEQLDNIAEQTNYNGNVLLQKSSTERTASSSLSFQIGETNRDIITNDSIQSNTYGLGSREKIENGATIASTKSLTIGSEEAITLTGKDSSGSNSLESVTLSGDVDKLTLTEGMVISNVDTATKAILDTMTGTGGAFTATSGGVYTVTAAGNEQVLDLSSVDNVQATVSTTPSTGVAAVDEATITSGQIVTTTATSGALFDTLNDASKFAKVGDSYRALGNQTLDLAIGDTISVYDLKNLASGASGGTFNAGDTITAINVTTGSYLDLELKDTSKFSTGATTGTYIVKANYTAGDLNIGAGESIKITQGIAVSAELPVSGLVESALAVSGTTVVRQSTGSTTLSTTTGGDQYAASNGNELTFTLTATSGGVATGTNLSYEVKAGDVITFTDANATATGGDQLSKDILESGNFLNIATGKYQAIASGTVNMDINDVLNVTRKLISNDPEVTVEGNTATSTVGAAAIPGVGSNDDVIKLKTDSAFTITNDNATTGSTLAVTGEAELFDNGTQLKDLAALSSGQLTTDLAASFQSVVDDAITQLNAYRGDIGSTQNQVESAVRNLMTQATNVKAAESIIRDVDYAQESANFNKQNIISQAGSYAISQSNAVQQNVLRLLQ